MDRKKIRLRESIEILGHLESGEGIKLVLSLGDIIEIRKLEPQEFKARKLKVKILKNVSSYKAKEELMIDEFLAESWQDRGLALILKK